MRTALGDAARMLVTMIGTGGAGPGSVLAGAALRGGVLRPLARRLAHSAAPGHREIAAALAAAIEARDDATALALVSTAARRPDLRAEKVLSRRYRFLWLCIPKAASRSIIAALHAADPGAVLIRGRTLDEVLAAHPGAERFYRFAFLRHPFTRTWSFHADKHTLARHDRTARRWFIDPWHGLRPGMSFAELCRWLDTPCGSDAFADRHWLSQSRQLVAADGRWPDFLGRYERLDADWRTVTERLGLPGTPLPRLNAGPECGAAGAAPDGDLATLLRRRYAEDFRLGGYADTGPGGP